MTARRRSATHLDAVQVPAAGRRLRSPRATRLGAVLSVELLLVLPILGALCLGIVELSLLLMGMQRVEAASSAACRVATLPASDPAALEQAVRAAAAQALLKQPLVQAQEIQFDLGQFPGDPVMVEVRVPMTAAAPDLLNMLGISLQGRKLVSRTVMRKE
jgi:Flp pilus assembly protein TadG